MLKEEFIGRKVIVRGDRSGVENRIREWVEDNLHDSGDSSCPDCGVGYGDGTGSGAGYGDGHGYDLRKFFDVVLGSGFGAGYSYSSGYGTGIGYGYGIGSGEGDRSGAGYDSDDSTGIASFEGSPVFDIDGVTTIISSVKGNVAIGAILHDDFTETPCFVAKGRGYFAHGASLREAVDALSTKIFLDMNTDEAIAEFVKHFLKDQKYAGKEFFEWHAYLTGSCLARREALVKIRGIDLEKEITVSEFIALCKDSYGGEVISCLEEHYM